MTAIYNLADLQQIIESQPEEWRPLVFTNGCFDLLHTGHVRYIAAAKALGHKLIVGLNDDRSVQQIKPKKPGQPPRPIVPAAQRAEVLAALRAVDGVVLFSETTATNTIAALRPDIYVKGGDYALAQPLGTRIATLPEAATVLSYGGAIELIQVEIPTSTSDIIRTILGGATS
jgi:D-glycero-beta-D-manno-heptose 1-phosphate adenylyltransferase